MKKRHLFILILFLVLLFISGCWDNNDVTELSIVSAIGLDRSESSDLEVTFRITKPIQGQAGGGKGSAEQTSSTLLSVKADTIMEAISMANTTLSRKLFLSQVQLVVVSEELATQENIRDILDYMERNKESNIQARMLISRGIKPKEVLSAHSEVEYLSIYHFINILKTSEEVSFMKDVQLFDIFKQKVTEGNEPYISLIQLSTGKQSEVKKAQSDKAEREKPEKPEKPMKMEDLSIEGVAVFSQGKMVGSLNPVQTWAALFVEDENHRGTLSIPNPLSEDKLVSIRVIGSQAKKSVQIINQTNIPAKDLQLSVRIKTEGIIGYQKGTGDLTKKEMVKKLEQQIADRIREDIEQVFSITQNDFKSDIFGFGSIVHKRHLKYWKEIKEWNELYSELPIKVEVEFKLKGSGYISQPMELR